MLSNGDRPITGYMRKPTLEEYRLYSQPKDVWVKGMTKREAFAMAAMQGMCAAYDLNETELSDGGDARLNAKFAVEHADELLKALENNNAD